MRDQALSRAFGRSLKSAREAAGLTQREAAERIDIAEKYLSRIEVGRATPSLPVAIKLAKLVGFQLDSLTAGAPNPTPAEIRAIVAMLRGRTLPELKRAQLVLAALFKQVGPRARIRAKKTRRSR